MADLEKFAQEQESEAKGKETRVFWLNIINETTREFKDYILTISNQFLRTVKGHIFKVEVTNHPKVEFPNIQKVEVTNHMSNKELADLLREVSGKLEKLNPQVNLTVPDEVSVKNFPKQVEPKFIVPKEFIVSNMGVIVKEIQKIANRIPTTVTVKQGLFDRTPKTEVNVDTKPFVNAIQALQDEIKRVGDKDVTIDIQAIVEAVNKVTHSLDTIEFPVPVFNHTPIVEAINNMKLNVDNIDIDLDQLEAINEKIVINTEEYGGNDYESPSDTITYIGKEDKYGNYLIIKVDTTSGISTRFATINNNALITTYEDAWTNRATLTYERFGVAL